MSNTPDNKFIRDFTAFQKIISHYGMYNSISQTLLKITSPGVPDIYQGTEIWDFSLVDPDNRRIVNYNLRINMLEELKKMETELSLAEFTRELTMNKENGKIKLYLIYKALNYRKKNRELFERGEYLPLEVMGKKADNVCAFVRRIGNNRVLIVAPRFFTSLISQPTGLPLGESVWDDTFIVIPIAEPGAQYINIFTGEMITAKNYKDATEVHLSDIFANFPVAMLKRIYN
ncbi:MAG: hypothetical protein A2Y81_12600 [Nitrospirae bacterium RBG_13_43_8]|nr:MAG: hypothetical protein A2Y81_12600 [Nitrospirae bacterium RBG_13_43_8]